ncbi:MAG: HPr family phosphocarrier protein [Anaerotignaceae bacterium]
MVEGKVILKNKTGMHACACMEFVSFVYKYKCNIFLAKDNKTANAKSLLNLLMLSLNCGDEVTIRIEGCNEEDILKSIVNYMENMRN